MLDATRTSHMLVQWQQLVGRSRYSSSTIVRISKLFTNDFTIDFFYNHEFYFVASKLQREIK